MTRNEFISDVNEWYDLLRVCSDNDIYSETDNIYSPGERDEYIEDMIRDMRWWDVRDYLYGLSDSDDFEYWIKNDYDEWTGSDSGDDIFDGVKDRVTRIMDENDAWEVDLDNEPDDKASCDCEPNEEIGVEEIIDFFAACVRDRENIVKTVKGNDESDRSSLIRLIS